MEQTLGNRFQPLAARLRAGSHLPLTTPTPTVNASRVGQTAHVQVQPGLHRSAPDSGIWMRDEPPRGNTSLEGGRFPYRTRYSDWLCRCARHTGCLTDSDPLTLQRKW